MPEPEVARLAAEWRRYAEEDLASAQRLLEAREHHQPRHVCFLAQQAAEKSIKSRYVARQVQYPFVHDLVDLASGLGLELEGGTKDDLDWLSQWAAAPRYPGEVVPEWEDAERAVRLTEGIVEAAREALA